MLIQKNKRKTFKVQITGGTELKILFAGWPSIVNICSDEDCDEGNDWAHFVIFELPVSKSFMQQLVVLFETKQPVSSNKKYWRW